MAPVSPETVEMFGEVTESVTKTGRWFICETEAGARITFEAAGALGERAVAVKSLSKSFGLPRVTRYVRVTSCSLDVVDM